MTVKEIQNTVAMYLQRDAARFDVSGTSANLILVAMNNARKYAERRHNWSFCRRKGYLSVPTGNKVAWDSPTWFGGGSEKMKEGKHWWLRGTEDTVNEWTSQDVPLKVIQHGVKHVVETKRQYEAWGEAWSEERYLNEGYGHPLLSQAHGVLRGKWMELYPRPSVTQQVVVDGYMWWPKWELEAGTKASVTVTGDWIAELTTAGDYLLVQVQESTTVTKAVKIQRVNNTSPVSVSWGGIPVYLAVPTELTVLDDSLVDVLAKVGIDAQILEGDLVITSSNRGVDTRVYVTKVTVADGIEQLEDAGTGTVLDVTDWWTENAEEYLILRSLVECNRLGHVFTGNKEGNLPSPEKQAEQALQDLIMQDSAGEIAGGQIELY